MKFLRVLIGLAIFILGIYAGWMVFTGLTSGEIMQLAKYGDAVFHKTVEPTRYWIASVMLIVGGINLIRKNL